MLTVHNICMHVCRFCEWCMHARTCCCRSRGLVEAYRNLLELMCKACMVALGSQVWWRHVNCASYEEIACIPDLAHESDQFLRQKYRIQHRVIYTTTGLQSNRGQYKECETDKLVSTLFAGCRVDTTLLLMDIEQRVLSNTLHFLSLY